MMQTTLVPSDPHPDFALEALEGKEPAQQRELLELLHRLPEALPEGGGPAALRARLLAEASAVPERYAPFARAVSELYDVPREAAQAVLERAARPRAWKRSGLPGVLKLPVCAGESRRGAQAYLVRFAAGATFPEHHHAGLETVLLLSGSYTDSSGQRFQTGDWHLMEPGTAHSFTIAPNEDCVAAVLLHGRLNFRSLPLRLFARLLGH